MHFSEFVIIVTIKQGDRYLHLIHSD